MGNGKEALGVTLGLAAAGVGGYFLYKKFVSGVGNTVLVTKLLMGYSDGNPVYKTVATTNCGYGGRITVDSWLSTIKGEPLEGFEVTLIDAGTGEEVWSGVTDENGRFSCDVWVEEENMPDSKLTVKLKSVFKGSYSYDPCASNEVTVHYVKPCIPRLVEITNFAMTRNGSGGPGAVEVAPEDPLTGTITYKNHNLEADTYTIQGYAFCHYDKERRKIIFIGFEEDDKVYIWGTYYISKAPDRGRSDAVDRTTYALYTLEEKPVSYDVVVFVGPYEDVTLRYTTRDYGSGKRVIGILKEDFLSYFDIVYEYEKYYDVIVYKNE